MKEWRSRDIRGDSARGPLCVAERHKTQCFSLSSTSSVGRWQVGTRRDKGFQGFENSVNSFPDISSSRFNLWVWAQRQTHSDLIPKSASHPCLWPSRTQEGSSPPSWDVSNTMIVPHTPCLLKPSECLPTLHFHFLLTTQQASRVVLAPQWTWTWQEVNTYSGRWGCWEQCPCWNKDLHSPIPFSSPF